MEENLYPDSELIEEVAPDTKSSAVELERGHLRARALAELDEARNIVSDGNVYHSRSVWAMKGSKNTIRNGRRNGRYRS